MKHIYITKSLYQTKRLAEGLAKKIFNNSSFKKTVVLALEGDLGGGKTTFLQGFAKGLGIKEKILSPTFVIMRKFEIRISKSETKQPYRESGSSRHPAKSQIIKFKTFYHIDCYRIQKPKELLDLGFKEIIKNPHNIVAIEWAERVKNIIPENSVWLKFEFINKNTRRIIC